ncbi:MAG: UDP-N-acetylmuramoyl-L-alanine--D-glutamate ligase [Deltaproteobacteria bacterium]|nr:UDP-N-acetylmuramoyl-L-alanine--D-glutamate ligase [Deltaproteobacteria bacterium]
MTTHPRSFLSGLPCSVLGIARSGFAAANWLAAAGADVLASDPRPLAEWPEGLDPRVRVVDGRNEVRPGDLVIISPGIKPSSPAFALAHARGREVWSDLELFGRLCPAPVVAITGTDGKSTTTAMIGEVFRAGGRPPQVGGNIGTAAMGILDSVDPGGVAVLEVSCFQLVHTHTLRPRVAVLTNLAEDHVDYHGSFDAYVDAKRRLLQAMGEGDAVVLNRDDPLLDAWDLPPGCRRLTFGGAPPPVRRDASWVQDGRIFVQTGDGPEALLALRDLHVVGGHNVQNAQAAALAGLALGLEPAAVASALCAFPGLEHRMEFVAEHRGVRYYNDSKATNPHAAGAVLEALEGSVVLIAGGSEKGSDFGDLGRLIAARTRAVVLNGQTRARLAAAIPPGHPVQVVEGLEEAVQVAAGLAGPGDMVVLAPACASFDQFRDFEHRGREFKRMVAALAG